MSQSTTKFGPGTTAEQVANALSKNITGKVAIITGGAIGLGRETAKELAKHGAHVILAVRNLDAGEETTKELIELTGNKSIEALKLDLGSLASIRAFAETFKAKNLPLHLLVNNAAAIFNERAETVDGFEGQFGTNHIGHFYLTNLLSSILIKSAPSRVVNVSSLAYAFGAVNFDDINFTKSYDKWASYAQSKTANILFTIESQKRLGKLGVTSVALHPGVIATKLNGVIPPEDLIAKGILLPDGTPNPEMYITLEEGAANHLYAALADVKEVGGKFLDKFAAPELLPYVNDDNAQKLWEVSEKLVGQTFTY